MSTKPLYSADVVDALIRDLLGSEPEALARFAHRDDQVRLRLSPGAPPTTDPLDGLDVMARHVIAISLALRRHRGAVSLATEQQALDAGWPSARLANLAITLGWAHHVASEPDAALPILLEADAAVKLNPFLRIDDGAAPVETLMAALRRRRFKRSDRGAVFDAGRPSARGARERRLASPYDLLRTMLGIDAHEVEIASDFWYPEPVGATARAVHVWAVVALEMIELTRVMQSEGVPAVRCKTEADAKIAGLPDARATNLALLLAASLNHGSGYTVTFLPADDRLAADLVEASRRITHRSGVKGDLRADVVDILGLEDMARRGYVHVGRLGAERVATRLFDAGRLG